jgi:plasmid stabilization system protein ParE
MRIRWTRPALHNLEEIQDYVAQDSPLAAYRLAHELVDMNGTGAWLFTQNGSRRSSIKYARTGFR